MKALIIEDNPIDQLKLKYHLDKMGYEAYIVDSVDTGRELFQSLPEGIGSEFAFIISDIRLSDGIVFEITDWPDIPIIFISIYEEEDYLESALQFSRSAFLNKPFTELTLKAVIRRLLENPEVNERFITVFGRHKNPIQIRLNDILYISSEGNYSTIFTVDEGSYTIKRSAKFLVEQLGEQAFVQIKRATYVHRPKFSKAIFQENKVLVGEYILEVSKKYKGNIYEFH